ncbi:hypothetical protein EJ05DRAFT_400292 [Pseudovirgaria hyperparasitica]|uniref:Uncharacterized protein n=1 Tax=Pseudovirgaria hyperparasitica TaxID=470096 RepID=A0A6A6W6E3_9PEZI|nr:uncharacterized protein EJ05DRAFT_400292 [Pseudovirgaria hyperparasitica]KAF2757759.1 hypothetical protein EJ05DRAFT_400292 [Pseudovirgaria hyperparasitica]
MATPNSVSVPFYALLPVILHAARALIIYLLLLLLPLLLTNSLHQLLLTCYIHYLSCYYYEYHSRILMTASSSQG